MKTLADTGVMRKLRCPSCGRDRDGDLFAGAPRVTVRRKGEVLPSVEVFCACCGMEWVEVMG